MNYYTIIVVILFLALTYFLSGLMTFIIKSIEAIAQKTKTQLDDIIVNTVFAPLRMIVILGGIFYTLYYINPFLTFFGQNMINLLWYLIIFFVAYYISKLIKSLFIWYSSNKDMSGIHVDDTIFKFMTNSVSIVIYIVAIIMILNLMGVQIAPMLAGLGIAGLAIALGLQDTLSNLFSALFIVFSKPVRVGQFIEINSPDIAGHIREIDWRTTKIETIGGNFYIIPNSHLANNIIKNYSEPLKRVSVIIDMGVSYDSDLEKVEKICIKVGEAMKKNMKVVDPKFETTIRYKQFGDSSINFIVILKAVEYAEQGLIRHEYMKAVFKEFNKQHIEIPFPQRDIHIKTAPNTTKKRS